MEGSSTQAARVRKFYERWLASLLADELRRHLSEDLDAHVLDHFRSVVREVPAYRGFLDSQGVRADQVATLADFRAVPFTTKQNYYSVYALPELCRGGSLDSCDMLAVSSGSTGEPAVWPRFLVDELGTSLRFEQVFLDSFSADTQSTLAVVCFALGSWVGGLYTLSACRHLAAKGYRLGIIAPGNQKSEIFRALRKLAPHYQQVVLLGYPPFLKDLIDTGSREGFDWSRQVVRVVTAGEVFSEEWRTLVAERLGGGDPSHTVAALYGTADGGVLANESPLSIRIRRLLAQNPKVAAELFGETRLPTLCQYDPLHRYFEVDGRELVFSGDSGAPLVRYKILDQGGICGYRELLEFLKERGLDPLADLGEATRKRLRPLPFVFVFGRSNFAVSFYGANVYPENLSVGLEQPGLARSVTGKFVMEVRETSDLNAELCVRVELAPGVAAEDTLAAEVADSLRVHLERLNSEYAHYPPAERRTPRVLLLPFAHPEYFPVGVKHRYTRS